MEENKLKLESLKTIDINPGAFLAAFHSGPYCLRTFAIRVRGRGKTIAFLLGRNIARSLMS